MQFVKDLSIRVKLLGGFAVVVALLAVVALISVVQLNSAADRAETLYSHDLVAVQQSLLTNQGMSASGRDEKQAFLTEDKGQRATWIAQSRKELDDAEKAMEAYHTTFRDEGDRTEWAAIEAKVNPVVAARRQTLTLLEQGNEEAAARNAATVAGQIGEMNKALNELAAKNAQSASDAEEAGASATDTARVVLIAVSVFAALVAAGVGFWLARYIAAAAGQATVAARSIARGNVNVSMSLNSRDEMGQLARSFGEMTEYLKGMVGVAGAIAKGDLSNEVQAKDADDACGNAFGEMTTYLKEMVGVATAVAGGDLTAEVRSRGASDALGNALAGMLDGLRGTVGEVRENASNILSASTQLREASDQMAGATGQIATAINDVTRSAVALASLSQDSAREVERVAAGSQQLAAAGQSNASLADQSKSEAAQMGERIAVVATASQQVATAAEASRDAARTGQDAVTQAVSSMEAIARAVEHASSTVNLLGEYGQQIGDIVKAIDEIAAQTNLLALNAAIEAARAGEQGRGFAVVAENVRTLAERSSDSTKEIAALIARVQSGTQEAVQAMAAGVADVQEGREITAKAGHALASIIEQVQQSAVQMERIAGDVQNLATGAERIVTSAETIAASADQSARGADEIAQGTAKVSEAILQVSATSEETSASAEEVSAATEELSAQSEELAATAGEMKSMAEALAQATTRFRLA